LALGFERGEGRGRGNGGTDGNKNKNKNKNGPCKMEIKYFSYLSSNGEGWVVGYRCGGFGDEVGLLVSGVPYPIRPGEEGSSEDALRYGTGMWS